MDKASAPLVYDLGVNLIYQARTVQEKSTQAKLLVQANASFKSAVSQNPNGCLLST